jgi:hypothetical protein
MKTEKDKEIDDLFKRGLEPSDTHSTHMEGDWEAMEQMLDERKRRPMIIYWLPILGSVAAVLLLVIGWWLLKPVATTQNPKQQKVAIQQPKVKTGNGDKEQQRTAGNNKIDTATAPEDLSARTEQQRTANNKIHTVTPPEDLPAGTTNAAIAKNTNTGKHTRMNGRASVPGLQSNYAANQPTNLAQKQQSTATNRQNNGDLVAYSPAVVIGSTQVNNDIIGPANVLPQDNNLNKPVYVANNKKKIASYGYKPQFAITALASSDKNGVNSFQQAKPGNNAGVLFSVGVSKRFTISTGAIYSAKQYMSDFASYHTSYQFQTNPVSVLADCKMFDVPLNIDYKIFNTYRNKISIGTGLSSYLMLHESYQFNYAGYADGPSHYNVPNPDKYLLSIVNFQATYERQINSNVGITLQPYMKLPLSAVGASQVRLQSTGLAVGLTWNLKSSSTP